jgi:ceramide glucosyltransferase
MAFWSVDAADLALVLTTSIGWGFVGLSLNQVMAFRECRKAPDQGATPPISILKPLCGDEPRLYECLRSFCDQDYPDFQIVFGVRSADDPAVAVVSRLRAEFPDRDLVLVCDDRIHGSNLKVSNLLNMMAACRHDLLAVSDSDVEIGRDGLRAVVAVMDDPTIGAVSCLYTGRATAGLVSRIGELNINGWIVPSVLLDKAINGIECSLGPVLLMRRQALDSIGGFGAVSDHLADDQEIGHLMTRAGWRVRLSPYTVSTMVDETSLYALFRHEVRWAQTVWITRPLDHALSVASCMFPILLLLLLFSPTIWGAAMVGGYLLLRLALVAALNARFAFARPMSLWLVPLRECLCFAVWVSCMTSRTVTWRGQPFRLLRGGRLVPASGSTST